MVARTWLSFTL